MFLIPISYTKFVGNEHFKVQFYLDFKKQQPQKKLYFCRKY